MENNNISMAKNQAIIGFEAVPDELKSLAQWVLWRSETRDDKTTKVPYDARKQKHASSTDSDTWCSFSTACHLFAANSQKYEGIGFVLSADDPYVGIDFDDCLEDGELKPWARELVDLMQPTYAEVSPSGDGIKMWIRADKTRSGNRKPVGDGKIEIYDLSRYFTVTGSIIESAATEIAENQEGLEGLFDLVWGPEEKLEPQGKEAIRKVDESDEEILKRVLESDGKFSQLWGGDCSNYPSQSEADLALCSRIAFWWQHDCDAIDRMFRQSGLYREKWERSDYRGGTIGKALAGTEARDPLHYFKNEVPCEGSSELYSTNQLPRTDAFFRDTLIDLDGKNLLWCDVLGKWLCWSGTRWQFDETRRIFKCIDGLVNHFLQLASQAANPDERAGYLDLAQRCGSHTRQKNIAEMLKPQLPVTVGQLDQQHSLLNAENGTVDLATGEVLSHSQGDHITKQANASYRPGSGCPRWIQFLDEIMGGNTELIQFLQRAIGYSLFGLTSEHYLFVLHGTGRNGKSTFLDVLMEILGDYAMPSAPDLLMAKRNDGHPTEVAELRGMRLVCCIETEQNKSLRESLIKRLTGGDQLKGRFLHQNYFHFKPTHTLFLATNRIPEVRGTDTGIWSRLRLIPFDVSFEGREEKDLKNTLLAEADGILSWAVQGAVEWCQHGLTFPDIVIQASQEWREDADLLGRFIDEKCATAELFETKSSNLYRVYKSYCDEGGERPDSANKFALQMEEKSFRKKKRNDGNYWLGIKVVEAYEFEGDSQPHSDVIRLKKGGVVEG